MDINWIMPVTVVCNSKCIKSQVKQVHYSFPSNAILESSPFHGFILPSEGGYLAGENLSRGWSVKGWLRRHRDSRVPMTDLIRLSRPFVSPKPHRENGMLRARMTVGASHSGPRSGCIYRKDPGQELGLCHTLPCRRPAGTVRSLAA